MKYKAVIVLEVEGEEADVDAAIENTLDAGVFQDTINDWNEPVKVTSALCTSITPVTDAGA